MTDSTRTLLLMRHSEAAHGGPDHDRALTDQGRADSRAAGRWLAAHVGPLDLVLVSSARRTRQTWGLAEEGGASAREVQVSDLVYEASLDALLAEVSHLPDEARTVLLVGHAPGIPMLANTLASADGPVDVRQALEQGFTTTTICRFAGDRDWVDSGAATLDLIDLVVPRG